MWSVADAMWDPVSPVGLKMTGDFPHHSDWLLGMTVDGEDFSLDDWYSHWGEKGHIRNDIEEAIFDYEHKLSYGSLADLAGDKLKFVPYMKPHGKRFLAGKVSVFRSGDFEPEHDDVLDTIVVLENGSVEFHWMLEAFPKAVILGAGGQLCHLAVNNFNTQHPMGLCVDFEKIKEGDNVLLDFQNGTITVID